MGSEMCIRDSNYRDIGTISLSDTVYKMVLNSPNWDERNLTFTKNGSIIYSDDRSGIFNLYLIDTLNQRQGYLTNVYGGSFMSDISQNGKILYSLYDNGGYKIAMIDSLNIIDESIVGYSSSYHLKNKELSDPIVELDTTRSTSYIDQFLSLIHI